LLLALSLLTAPVTAASRGALPTTVVFTVGSPVYTVNGRVYAMDVAPFIAPRSNRLYVPARFLAQALGAAVSWNAATAAVALNLEENGGWGRDLDLGLVVGEKTLTLTNGPGSRGIQAQFVFTQKVAMDTAPVIVDGRAMVPARWVGQALGCGLRWDQAGQRLVITAPESGL